MSVNFKAVILTAILTALVSWISIYLTHHFQISREIHIHDRERRQETFSSLMGLRLIMSQLYLVRFEALIYSDFHENKWRLAGHPSVSVDLDEAKRWMNKSEELALEIAIASQKLYTTVGLVRILLTQSKELKVLTDAVYKHSVPNVDRENPKTIMSTDDLNSWKYKAVKQLRRTVEKIIDELIQNLIDHVETKI